MNLDLACFLKDVINSKTMPDPEDSRITQVFDTYDKDKNGYLEREGFINFYVNCTKTSKKSIVWDNLNAMGVRNDLKMVRLYELNYKLVRRSLSSFQL